jgi:RimJ/RimL family protein N-acetyltransferase
MRSGGRQGHRRQGLGSELLRWLVQIARHGDMELIWADLLASNVAMRRTAESLGFRLIDQMGEPTARAELRLV